MTFWEKCREPDCILLAHEGDDHEGEHAWMDADRRAQFARYAQLASQLPARKAAGRG